MKYGDLLLCEKALAYCFAHAPEEFATSSSAALSQSSFLMDIPGNTISAGCHADLIRDISNKLVNNPSLVESFHSLYSGDYTSVDAVDT